MSHIAMDGTVNAKDWVIPNGVKKTKTPRNYDSILKGALQLSFAEKVELRKEISKSIETTLENVRNRADEYSKLAKE